MTFFRSMYTMPSLIALPRQFPITHSMLFYASEKYPKEDEYSKFISDNGGYTNAWTASENTNYQVGRKMQSDA
jgi:hypothetical protein